MEKQHECFVPAGLRKMARSSTEQDRLRRENAALKERIRELEWAVG
jgi:hypothetical protein